MSDKQDFPTDWDTFVSSPELHALGIADQPQIRLNWAERSTTQFNSPKIEALAKWAKTHGGDGNEALQNLLNDISLEDLNKRFKTKFDALRKVWRGTARKQDEDSKRERDFRNRAEGVSYNFISRCICVR